MYTILLTLSQIFSAPLDFDECQGGAHDCHVDAMCSTTRDGGYECICKAGFEGDGRTCTGMFIKLRDEAQW